METTTLFIIPPVIYGDIDYYLIRGLIDLLATSLDLYDGISAMAPIMIEVDPNGKAKRELQNHFRFLGEDSPEEELLEFVERCYPESGAALLPIIHAHGKSGELKFTLRVISHQGRYPLFEMHWHGRILEIVKSLSRDVSLVAEHCGGSFKEDSKFVWPTTENEEALKGYLHGLALSKNYQAIPVGTNYRQALNLLFRSLDLDPKLEFSAFRIVGFSEYLLENTELALDAYYAGIESLKKLTRHYKLSGRAQVFLAQALQRHGEETQAEKIFEQAITQHPEDAMICLEVATFYEQQNKIDLAEQIYQKYSQLQPNAHPDILLNQGVLYAKKGNLDEAIACWKKTLKADPHYHTAYGNLMNAYFDKNDISCMWVFFELGLKQTPVPWKNYENIFQHAGSEKLPDFEPGILYLEEYLRQNPEDAYACLALAQVLNHLGDKKKALRWAHLARDKATSGVEKGYAAWQALIAQNEHFEEDIEKIQKESISQQETSIEQTLLNWIQEEPSFWQGCYLLGKIYHRRQDHQKALQFFLNAWNTIRNIPEITYDIGNEYQILEQLEEAKKFYRMALQLNPYNASYMASLAHVLFLTDEKEQASQCIQRATLLDPKNPQITKIAKKLIRPSRFWSFLRFWKKRA